MINQGLQLYLTEAKKHKSRYQQELDELREDHINAGLKSRDYRAAERLLQVYTELCIGLAKHWLKQVQGQSSGEAYQTFQRLTEHGKLSGKELNKWRKIIGMRNGLVHDYLNVDPLIVIGIIEDKHYQDLSDFVDKAITELQNNQ